MPSLKYTEILVMVVVRLRPATNCGIVAVVITGLEGMTFTPSGSSTRQLKITSRGNTRGVALRSNDEALGGGRVR